MLSQLLVFRSYEACRDGCQLSKLRQTRLYARRSQQMQSLCCRTVTVVSSVLVVSVVTPPVLLAIVALALVYRQIQRRYVATSRELKRCD